MNDRFKFRAWYNPGYREPIMLYDVEQTYDDMFGEPESIPSDSFGSVLGDKDFVVMQSTGLHDKNRKLIYEGDIVDIWKMAGNIHKRMVVKWYQPQCSFRLFDLSAMGATPQKMVDKRSLGAVTTIEVIGNIYENKELLEEYEDE